MTTLKEVRVQQDERTAKIWLDERKARRGNLIEVPELGDGEWEVVSVGAMGLSLGSLKEHLRHRSAQGTILSFA